MRNYRLPCAFLTLPWRVKLRGTMNMEVSGTEKARAVEEMHRKQKDAIGFRLQVTRVLVRRYYQDKRDHLTEFDFTRHCEAVLDNMLCRYNYDNEAIIDKWREILPLLKQTPMVCEACGYRPVFCLCDEGIMV